MLRRVLTALLLVIAASCSGEDAREPEPARQPLTGSALVGTVTRHGFPVPAKVAVWRVRPLVPGVPVAVQPRPLLADLGQPVTLGPPLAEVETDDGRFVFDGLEPGEYEVIATIADGDQVFSWAEIRFAGERAPADSWHQKGTVPIDGVASRPDGTPFRGFIFGPVPVRCDAEGRFKARLTPGQVSLTAREVGAFDITLDVERPRDGEEVRLLIDPGPAVEGRVTEAGTGAPVAGARILTQCFEPILRAGALSGGDGRFRVHAPPERGWIRARADGYVPWERIMQEMGPSLEIRLERTPSVSGAVRTAEGGAVPGVPVYLLELVSGSIEEGRAWTAEGAFAFTDVEGRFSLESPVVGDAMVFACGRGWITRDLADATSGGYNPAGVALSPGGRHEMQITVEPAARIVGRVLHHDGTPAVGARVTTFGETGHRGADQWRLGFFDSLPETVTDLGGRFALDSLVPGFRYSLFVHEAGGSSGESPDPVRASRDGARLEIRLDPIRWLEALVVDAESGGAIEGVNVEISQILGHLDTWVGVGGITGPQGEVRVGPLPGELVAVEAFHDDYTCSEPIPIHDFVDGTATVTIRLDRCPEDEARADTEAERRPGRPTPVRTPVSHARLELTLLDERGRPVSGGTVSLREVAGDRLTSPVGEEIRNGRAMPGVRATDRVGWLDIRPPRPWGATLVGPVRLDTGELEVRLATAGTIPGHVVGPDGSGIRGVRVNAVPYDARLPPVGWIPPHGGAWTDARGRFEIGGLGQGYYLLMTYPSRSHVHPPPPLAQVGGAVKISLRAAVRPRIEVLDADGKPLPEATVTVEGQGQTWADVETDEHGVVELGWIDPGHRYFLTIEPPFDSDRELFDLEVEAWKPESGTYRLERALTVAGVVVDRWGRPVFDVEIGYRFGEESWSYSRTEGEGRFRKTGFHAGPVFLKAGRDGDVVEVAAGAADARVVTDVGPSIVCRIEGLPEGEAAQIILCWRNGDWRRVRAKWVSYSGMVRFDRLRSDGPYALYAEPFEDGTFLFAPDLRSDGSVVVLSPIEGRMITGRLVAPEGGVVTSVYAYLVGHRIYGKVGEDGRFIIRGLPEGKFWVTGNGSTRDGFLQGSSEVEAGADVEIELEKLPD